MRSAVPDPTPSARDARPARISVIGTGYLGAVHAVGMAILGHDVLGVDADAAKIEKLAAGRAPFYEPQLPELLARALDSGRLRFSTSLADAAQFGDVHFLCVGTPQRPGSDAADLTQVEAVIDELAPMLQRPCLIVGKSTVPVGTADRLAQRVAALAPAGVESEVAWNPEFVREGFAIADTLAPNRIVVGGSRAAAEALAHVYAPFLGAGTPLLVTNRATAELAKVAANAFLATKISFVNAMADMCDAVGADVTTLADAIGHDERIGRRFLDAGLGFGGGCLSKDIRALAARAEELGVGNALTFLRVVDQINGQRRRRTVDVARELVGGTFLGQNVAVLGAAFKPGSDDVRDSPALDVAAAIQLEGAQVRVHDPEALDNARVVHPTLEYTPEVEKACERADVVLHLTDWAVYRSLDPRTLAAVVRQARVLDARNALDLQLWRAGGWTVRALGRAGV
jgi:UDPglucose 6-dehydrogenase